MIERVAYISLHTSPLLQPGSGYAGGMNVYLHELSIAMADRGVDVVVFTRRVDPAAPTVVDVRPGYRVVHIDAGPPQPLTMAAMPRVVGEFTDNTIGWIDANAAAFDVVHSHYWLSGWSGVILKEKLGMPLANSFHTLGRIKDLNRRSGEPASGLVRTLTEEEVIARSDCVVASTRYELDDLLEHYSADPTRLCTSPPGIQHQVFTPGDRQEARSRTGLNGHPIILFVGRIQPLKAADVAIAAVAELPAMETAPHLVLIGGPSGPEGDAELTYLRDLTGSRGLSERVHFLAPQPHEKLARFYRAADVLIMPSRSESFGLVAAEAQACGLPVVSSDVGGLPFVVADGKSGVLVSGHDPGDYAAALGRILNDTTLRAELSAGAVDNAAKFSWPSTISRLLELYDGIK